MTDTLRKEYKYDCTLEEGAVNWASQCPTTLSEPSTRPNVGENFKTFPATRFNFDTAAKKASHFGSVTEWWKVIRDVNYFERVVVFRPFHDGAPISSFTQMGWATSNLLGCAIVRCRNDGRYVGVCRYSPRGNIVNSNVYQVGTPCSACPTGASSCSTADGLCF
ncbi:SCP-like protein [Ancylostoma caninum]|uniref:SCP-like protein n=1 Tax=Ancylostoma caninum TaxID=29170 RepID=A0A368GJL9_ANCCA|nr:SCP-like protein [Ancylostoma caninum]